MHTAIWWIRRDLRLTDNQALHAALANARLVVPVFVLDPFLLASPMSGSQRIAFLFEGLRALDLDLRRLGSRLLIREGEPVAALAELSVECGAGAIFAEADVSPYARRRDARVRDRLPLTLTGGLTLFPPELVLKNDGRPYTVFTPYSKAWKALPRPGRQDLLARPLSLGAVNGLYSLPIPSEPALSAAAVSIPGEGAARGRLDHFLSAGPLGIYGYAERRNRTDVAGTSSLSPQIRFGMLSIREVVAAAAEAVEQAPDARGREGAEAWLNELIWREFYQSILFHFPSVLQGSFRAQYAAIQWQNDPAAFEAWCQGRTGYPIVDAAMRQLLQSGWMHNRARMISASFLVKDLLIDWRWGERWFMQHLLDGDPAPNNGGWQWTAGTGTDAAPYFRVFNPVRQSEKFDPHGAYIRRWLPELGGVPQKYIHEPWRMPEDIQSESACRIGQDYPAPLVDHAAARQRALVAYKQAQGVRR